MKTLILCMILSCLFCSCVNTRKTGIVWIPKNVTFYERKIVIPPPPAAPIPTADVILTRKTKKGIKARITLNPIPATANTFTILSDTLKRLAITTSINATPANTEPSGRFFPYSPDATSLRSTNTVEKSLKFKYWEVRPVLQTLSIPIKYRPKLNDTTKSIASASFNVGIAWGLKFTKNTLIRYYSNTGGGRTPTNDVTRKWTFTPGAFAGPTVVDLKSSNTYSKVTKDRSVVGLTCGGFFVIGYNEINAGLAVGIDKTFGTDAKNWMYNGKPWIGFVIAIDLIK